MKRLIAIICGLLIIGSLASCSNKSLPATSEKKVSYAEDGRGMGGQELVSGSNTGIYYNKVSSNGDTGLGFAIKDVYLTGDVESNKNVRFGKSRFDFVSGESIISHISYEYKGGKDNLTVYCVPNNLNAKASYSDEEIVWSWSAPIKDEKTEKEFAKVADGGIKGVIDPTKWTSGYYKVLYVYGDVVAGYSIINYK